MTGVQKFTINRATWDKEYLCWSGKMCVLGQIAHASGIPEQSLGGKTRLYLLQRSELYKLPKCLQPVADLDGDLADIRLAVEAMSINDSPCTKEALEADLTKLFRSHGVELSWVGHYTDD